MWTGMVARARGPLSSDGGRTCLSEGISPWAPKVDGAGLTEAFELPALNGPGQTTLSDWGF